ncbi:DUF3551 domain-containing protein [Bradyrhizobium tropiciagri]|uniref:DUF3551 domain-containing protein n=1 Tax=Bradyrhizobium tropiciagri TaxID=312253 RepID=UPI000AF2AE83|nr:DUF3551 domain-containing protein [Bradyrhizobium tropiciagri]
MRFAASSLLLILTIAGFAASASPASAREFKYCLQGRHWGYPGNCSFATYAQCRATASGTNAGCGVNPRYAFARQRRGHADVRSRY